jgi:hypothetical protein
MVGFILAVLIAAPLALAVMLVVIALRAPYVPREPRMKWPEERSVRRG